MPRQPAPSVPSHRQRSGRPPLSEESCLSPAQIQQERLLLAQDMVHLVLEEGQALPAALRQRLRQIYDGLATMRQRAW